MWSDVYVYCSASSLNAERSAYSQSVSVHMYEHLCEYLCLHSHMYMHAHGKSCVYLYGFWDAVAAHFRVVMLGTAALDVRQLCADLPWPKGEGGDGPRHHS